MSWVKVWGESETLGDNSNPGLTYSSNHELLRRVYVHLTTSGRIGSDNHQYSMFVMGAERKNTVRG